jgi:TPR repeat protein
VAEYQLALRYRDGSWGVNANPQLALGWLQMAANHGNPVAMATLADAYDKGGFGLTADPTQSRLWHQRADAASQAGTEVTNHG